MIRSNPEGRQTLKQIREREKKEKEAAHRIKQEAYAVEKYGQEKIVNWSNANKGLWYMSVDDEDGNIVKLSIMKPIDRHILSHASTKIEDDGLYLFLEACMNECLVNDDEEGKYILEDEEAFIAGAQEFKKIMEAKKVTFLKR